MVRLAGTIDWDFLARRFSSACRVGPGQPPAVDTTVQEKAITHPSDARLTHRAIEKLVELAKREEVELRQSYLRLAKHAAIMAHWRHGRRYRSNHHLPVQVLRPGDPLPTVILIRCSSVLPPGNLTSNVKTSTPTKSARERYKATNAGTSSAKHCL